MGTKTGHIYGKGAPQTFGGAVAPNCPLDPPLNATKCIICTRRPY